MVDFCPRDSRIVLARLREMGNQWEGVGWSTLEDAQGKHPLPSLQGRYVLLAFANPKYVTISLSLDLASR
jgi:hypothetical protein